MIALFIWRFISVVTETTNINGSREYRALGWLTRDALCWLARYAVALVWAYNGIYCKLFLGDTSHLEVFASLPFINPAYAIIPLAMLGVFEAVLAGWVLSGWTPRHAACIQTVLLCAMNAGGLLWARDSIPHPAGMVVQNIAFLVLVWLAASKGDRHERAHD